MLPDNFRFTIENRTTVTIDASLIVIKHRGKYFDSNGKLTYEAESADVANQSGTIADAAFNNGITVNNGIKTNPMFEADVSIAISLSGNTGTPVGKVIIFLQRATNDTPVFSTDGENRDKDIIAVASFTSKEDKILNVTVD